MINLEVINLEVMFSLIVARDAKYGIGKNGSIPWHYPEDLKVFREMTIGQVLIQGRVTYESILKAAGGPLKDRIHIVISTGEPSDQKDVYFVKSPEAAVELFARKFSRIHKGIVIGGAKIYDWFISRGYIRTEIRTEIFATHECDAFYNPPNVVRTNEEVLFQNEKLKIIKATIGKNEEEQEFLRLGKRILELGDFRQERTGIGAHSLFGHQLRFNLRDHTFPLLTTRKMFLTGIFEELMFYLRGQTDNTILESKGIKVWTANTTREFLDERGLQRLPVGDMGPSYGFLFRYFGAQYETCKTDYSKKEAKVSAYVDQLAQLIKKIKTKPTDRRMIISLWDPTNEDKCPLPPCLYNYQFYVRGKYLSCMMTQRSSDYAIAGGWNIATGALFVILLAAVCDLQPDTLIWNIGDAHLYTNAVEGFKAQLERQPRPFPKIFINKKFADTDTPEVALKNLEAFQKEDLILIGYEPHDAIKFTMNA